MDFVATPITGTFGAEISGGNLRDLEDGSMVNDLLCEHLLLVFRDQHLTHGEQSKVARLMGEVTPAHPVVPGHPEFPEILELDANNGGKNARWHTDVTFVATPPAASVLVADAVPPFGGDTMWADARSAYDRLHPALREAIDQLDAVHRIAPLAYWGEPFDSALGREDAKALFDHAATLPFILHPMVRIHPVTGRRSIFVNPGFTTHVAGMSRIESEHLLRMLYDHLAQPELTLRHRWQLGDVVMWDNRATLHYAVDDYGVVDRRMRRITLRGGTAIGPSGSQSRVIDDPLVAVR